MKKQSIIILIVFLNSIRMFSQTTIATAMGDGLDGMVYQVVNFNDTIFAVGDFTHSGSIAINSVAKWNGVNWEDAGFNLRGKPKCLAVFNNFLYASGDSVTVLGSADTGVVKLVGSQWMVVGGNIDAAPKCISVLSVFQNELYIGGNFQERNSSGLSLIVKYNGNSFVSLPNSYSNLINGGPIYGPTVTRLCEFKNKLYVGGRFIHTSTWNGSGLSIVTQIAGYGSTSISKIRNGSSSVLSIAEWQYTTTKIHTTPDGVNYSTSNFLNCLGSFFDVETFNGENIYGGNVLKINSFDVNHLFKYNSNTGNYESYLGGITGGSSVNDLDSINYSLIVAGRFTSIGGVNANNIAIIKTISTEPTIAASAIGFSNKKTNSVKINLTKGNGNKRLIIARTNSYATIIPTDMKAYLSNAQFSLGDTVGDASSFVVYNGNGDSVTVNGLEPDTKYFFTVIEYNDYTGIANYQTASTLKGEVRTLSEKPSLQTQALSFSNVQTNSITVNFTGGNGLKRLLLASLSPNINTSFIKDTNAYIGISDFSTAQDMGSGTKVVYSGNANSQVVNGLLTNTRYYFVCIEYNGTDANTTNYLLVNPAQGSQSTLNTSPSIQPSNLVFTNITDTSMTLNWNNGDGSHRIVVAKNATVNAVPTDGVEHIANNVYSMGDDLGLNNYVVYSGASNTFNLTGLQANTNYHFAIYEYNGTNSANNYLEFSPLVGNASTLVNTPTLPATNLQMTAITSGISAISWTKGNGANRIVVVRESQPLNELPDDANSYTANASFSLGTDLGQGNYVAYIGSGNSFNLQGLDENKAYYVGVIEFNGNSTATNYYNEDFPMISNMPASPTLGARNMRFTKITGDKVKVDWVKGNGAYRILIVKETFAVSKLPVDGNTYSASTTFALGDNLGSNNYVVYVGAGNNTTVLGIDSTADYYFSLIEFNKNPVGPPNYFNDSILTGYYNASSVGFNEIKLDSKSVIIFPNPTNEWLEIESKNHSFSEVGVYDLTGKVISNKQLEGLNRINLSFLETGMYQLILRDKEGNRLVKSVVINH